MSRNLLNRNLWLPEIPYAYSRFIFCRNLKEVNKRFILTLLQRRWILDSFKKQCCRVKGWNDSWQFVQPKHAQWNPEKVKSRFNFYRIWTHIYSSIIFFCDLIEIHPQLSPKKSNPCLIKLNSVRRDLTPTIWNPKDTLKCTI